jgi:hypothetical protein
MNKDMPLLFDHWFSFACELEDDGKWDIAARVFRHLASIFQNVPYMQMREANALYQFGDYRSALQIIELMERPTVSSYLLGGRCWKRLDKPEKSVIMYNKAMTILERKVV